MFFLHYKSMRLFIKSSPVLLWKSLKFYHGKKHLSIIVVSTATDKTKVNFNILPKEMKDVFLFPPSMRRISNFSQTTKFCIIYKRVLIDLTLIIKFHSFHQDIIVNLTTNLAMNYVFEFQFKNYVKSLLWIDYLYMFELCFWC